MSETAEDGPAWERAMAANKRRTELAQQQIRDARAEPTSSELEAQAGDAQLRIAPACAHWMWTQGCTSCADWAVKNGVEFARQMAARETPPDTLTLSGAKLAAYRQLETAAAAAHEAQQTMTTTGVALREAIQAMCAALAPGAK